MVGSFFLNSLYCDVSFGGGRVLLGVSLVFLRCAYLYPSVVEGELVFYIENDCLSFQIFILILVEYGLNFGLEKYAL